MIDSLSIAHQLRFLLVPLLLDTPQPPDIGSVVNQFYNQFVTAASQLLASVNAAVIVLSRLTWITLLMLGVLLYATRFARRLGRDLITGGVLLAILSELLFPVLSKL